VVAIVATVAYSVDTDKEDAGNSSKPDNLADNVLVSLPILQYPLPGKHSSLNLEVHCNQTIYIS